MKPVLPLDAAINLSEPHALDDETLVLVYKWAVTYMEAVQTGGVQYSASLLEEFKRDVLRMESELCLRGISVDMDEEES